MAKGAKTPATTKAEAELAKLNLEIGLLAGC